MPSLSALACVAVFAFAVFVWVSIVLHPIVHAVTHALAVLP